MKTLIAIALIATATTRACDRPRNATHRPSGSIRRTASPPVAPRPTATPRSSMRRMAN